MSIHNHHDMLEHIAEGLDIPSSQYESAVRRYDFIGDWLGRDESELSGYEIKIFPQGSMLLGTVTRPIRETEQYDIDLVCRVSVSKQSITQRWLKNVIGNEVRSYAKTDKDAVLPLKEGRMCWALRYQDDVQFHMDIVPALPDVGPYRIALRNSGHFALAESVDLSGQAIAITDNTSPGYSVIVDNWMSSNPLGYAAWFRERMKQRFTQIREALAVARLAARVDDIPEYAVKTPLQRAVQLLKRHRDFFFHDHPERRPASIIVTTLAAHAYRDEEGDIASALPGILHGMPRYIEDRDGVDWIPNPVYPEENFADRWRESSEKRQYFDHWLRAAQHDFGTYLRASQYHELPQDLRRRLGADLVDRTLRSALPSATVKVGNNEVHRATAEAEAIRRERQPSKPWARR